MQYRVGLENLLICGGICGMWTKYMTKMYFKRHMLIRHFKEECPVKDRIHDPPNSCFKVIYFLQVGNSKYSLVLLLYSYIIEVQSRTLKWVFFNQLRLCKIIKDKGRENLILFNFFSLGKGHCKRCNM